MKPFSDLKSQFTSYYPAPPGITSYGTPRIGQVTVRGVPSALRNTAVVHRCERERLHGARVLGPGDVDVPGAAAAAPGPSARDARLQDPAPPAGRAQRQAQR